MLKSHIHMGWLSPVGWGAGGGVLLCGGRSFLLPLMCCMAVLLVSGFWGNRNASAAVDSYAKPCSPDRSDLFVALIFKHKKSSLGAACL